jgi:molybdopterin-guanine dinucleotide biosynthesis protein A
MFEAFILAGGKSARMGKEKALVEINRESLVNIAAKNLRSCGASKVTVLAGMKTKSLRPYFPELEIVEDVSPELGAPGAILTALQRSETEGVFVIACDLPFASSELITFLWQRFEGESADAVVPVQPDSFKQTLCAFYRKSKCLVPFQGEILRSDLTPSVRAMIEKVSPVYVSYEEIADLEGAADFFLNLNTPLDLEHAREIARAK